MRYIYLALLMHCIVLPALAQTRESVKAVILDTAAHQPIASATITLLKKKDSSLVSFTMSDTKGRFELSGLANGDYRLLVTHVNYHSLNKHFTIDDAHKTIDFGSLVMTSASKVLDEVVVTSEAPPVTLVGDTVQYNAGSFKTPPNANVEQLLKKLPGLEVDKDGTIKAQGQKVNRVLVDGKEFFGNDPKLATRNLPSDAVDKVQVFDKLSDAAQLTGFDDGNSEKTINLKLKQDKKKGMFGKVSAGGGTNDRYEGKFNVNSFKGARQFSAIGMANNTNAEGFSFMDILNFSGGLSNLTRNSSGVISLSANDAASGGANTNGIRTTRGAGINYNDVIGKQTQLTSSYFYNYYNPYQESTAERQYFLPDSSYFYNQQSKTNNSNNNHRLNLSFDIPIDSFHSIKISPAFKYQQTSNDAYNQYQTFSQEKVLANAGSSDNYSTTDGYNFTNDLLFRKKFRRKGRTFSVALQGNLNQSDGSGSLQSVTSFFKSGIAFRTDSVNQKNTTSAHLGSYSARAVYTEPVFKRSLLELSVSRSNIKNTSDKTTYSYNEQNSKFDQLVDSLSNHYINTYGFTNAGIRLRNQQRKFNIAAGFNWQKSDLEGKITAGVKDSIIGKTFYNLLPSARLQYDFSQYRKLIVNYNTNTTQPSVSQLQPVPDISNSLNIKEGNPNLKQEYAHSLMLNYTSVNPFKNRNLFVFVTAQKTQNKIVDADSIDNLGVRRTKPVNVDGVYSLTGNASVGLPLRFLKGVINISSNATYNSGKQFINGVANTIHTLNLGPSVRVASNVADNLDWSLKAGITYNHSAYSLQPDLNTKYLSQQYEAEVNWQLPASFYLSTDLTYTINNQLGAGFNAKVPLWNASFSKQFLKYKRGEIKLTVFDLLNQNIGVSRSSNQNYIEDTRIKNLQRYFMLSFTFSLSKMGLGMNEVRDGGIRIMR